MITPYRLLASLAAVALVAFLTMKALRPGSRAPWWGPALASVLFLGFTAYVVATEGPLGFWNEHIHDAWGNQIWIDLLLSCGLGWSVLLPRVRQVGMRPWAWAIALVLTGSIGLLAMLARLLYLERASTDAGPARA